MSPLSRTLRHHAHAIALGLLVVASLVFRIHVARTCSLWLDEDFTHMGVVKGWPAVLAGTEPWHPPLFFVLTKLGAIPFGYSEAGLRAVSLASGCVLLLAVYWLCLELELGATRALAVVVLLAVTPFFVRHTVEARQYGLYPALFALAFACALRFLREPRRLGYFAGFAVSAGALSATHYFGLAYAVALFGLLMLGLVRRPRELELTPARALALALTVVAFAVVLLRVLERVRALAAFYASNRRGGGTVPWSELLAQIIAHFSGVTQGAAAPFIELGLAAVGLVLVARSLRGITGLAPFGLAFGPCLVSLFITSGHFVAPRYLAPSWVLYHVGACVALFALADGARRLIEKRAPRLGVPVATAVVAAPLALRLTEYPGGFGAGEDDYRGLQSYFKEHLAPNTALVTFPGHAGVRMMEWEYPVGSPPIELEHFRKRAGIERYLVAEIHLGATRRAEFDRRAVRSFGLTAAEWRALPLVDLPENTYQPAVRARLVVWNGAKVEVPRASIRRGSGKPEPRGAEGDAEE